jgi:2,3-diketo-5-methylthio-1-phosphopentane phosphatase
MSLFCDFDGTIAYNDLFDQLTDHFTGDKSIRQALEAKIISGEMNYNEVLQILLQYFKLSFNEALQVINDKNEGKVIDIHFKEFYEKCIAKNINFYIISSGLKQLITHYLPYVPPDRILANDVCLNECHDDWQLKLYENKGIFKQSLVEQINPTDKKIYIGDGLSDISVVDSVDILFTKSGSYLHQYCRQHQKKHIPFDDFKNLYEYICTF